MKHALKISRTAHYYVQPSEQKSTSVLIVIHGYAQLAKDFIKDFKQLKSSRMVVIAPEAISKFYNKERVPVASWMTSYEREDEIHDYIHYLNEFIATIKKEFKNLPLAVLGFSQGVSTTMRWVVNCPVKIDQLFLCCGSIPPELKADTMEFNHDVPVKYYYGLQDRLLKTEKAKEQISILESFRFKSIAISFDGRHEIHQDIIDDLNRLSESF